MNKRLTIVGGTGHLSTRVVRILQRRGVELTLVARNPDKAKGLFGDSVKIVFGDVENPASLHEAFRESDAIYVHLNTETVDASQRFYTEREGVKNIVAAAEANNVQQLIQIAGIEAIHPEFFRGGILCTEQIRRVGMEAIKDSSIPHTFLNCSVFLDSVPRFVDDGVLALFGNPDHRIHFTNSEQLAEHLYQVIGNPRAFNKSIPVQGSEGLTFSEAAQRFFSKYDPEVHIAQMPLAAIDDFGLPDQTANFLKHVWEVMSGLHEDFVSDEIHHQFGSPPLSIEEFATTLRAERG